MESTVWHKALALLKYDTANIDMVTYDSILCKMSVAFCDDNMLILAARDEFSLKLVKGQKLSKIIEDAIKTACDGKSMTVSFVLEGDESAINSTVNSVNKAVRQAKSEIVTPTGLNGEFTFANFVVGRSNAQAHLASLTCDYNLALIYNPLFIYGNSGLGKTHLLNAIGNQVKALYPEKRIGFISGLEFVEGVHKASQENRFDEFKESFQKLNYDQVKGIIDIELAIPAQMKDDVALEVLGRAPIYEYCRSGGMLFDDEGVYNAIKKIIDGGA